MRPRLGIDIAAPDDLAWEELIELDNWPGWGPTVSGARLDDGSDRVRAGSTGAVQTPVGLWLPFTVDQWHDGGSHRTWGWRVGGVPATVHSVIGRGEDRCRVEMTVPWFAPAYLSVVALALSRIRRRVETKARPPVH